MMREICFELFPDDDQENCLRRFIGASRFVFNRALVLQNERLEKGEKRLSYDQLCEQLKVWKMEKGFEWMANAPVSILEQSLRALDITHRNIFARGIDHPRYRRKGRHDYFHCPKGVEVFNESAYLPGLGWVSTEKGCPNISRLKNVIISYHKGRWFAFTLTQWAAFKVQLKYVGMFFRTRFPRLTSFYLRARL